MANCCEDKGCEITALRARHKRPWRIFLWPALWYSEWLLSSIQRFSSAIVIWAFGVWWMYEKWLPVDGKDSTDQLQSFDHAISTFFGVGTLADQSVFSAFVIVAGLFHLSIFISLIYDLVNRR